MPEALVKIGSSAALLAAVAFIIGCPCSRVGRCHLGQITGLVLAAAALLLVDNVRTVRN